MSEISRYTNATRGQLLETFSEASESDAVWNNAYHLVRIEGDDTQEGIASDIPAEELIAFAQAVRQTPVAERYALTVEKASNGELWFDVLETFSSDQINWAIYETLDNLRNDYCGRNRFKHVLEIGTGTGETTGLLVPLADRVTAVDYEEALLNEAKRRVAGVYFVRADATQLPFDEPFDVIVSQGVTGALDQEQERLFWREVSGLLKPNGVFIEGFYGRGYSPELLRIKATAKGVLADMIVDTVTGKFTREQMDQYERWDIFAGLGLEAMGFEFRYDDGRVTVVRVVKHADSEIDHHLKLPRY